MAALGRISAGDLVEVDHKGRIFKASVVGIDKVPGCRGTARIEPLDRNVSYTSAKSSEIKKHWRRVQ